MNINDYPTLPADATPENFIKEREAARQDNTRDTFHTSKRHIRSFGLTRRCQIAKPRLLTGKYGVDAKDPCDICRENGEECRLVHPMLLTAGGIR